MCDFKPGDEVVCVDARSRNETLWPSPLVEGQTYVVSRLVTTSRTLSSCMCAHEATDVFLMLAGLTSPSITGGFHPTRFRKVQRLDLSAWLETAATDTDHLDKPIKTPARPKVDALLKRVQSGAFG